ncbi:MAG TPA: cyclic nucleotide-binding domain-containing protein, partial [Kofleriaceae bacterium]|nr:cyclic nucleotide-binding domain-containing protein [Kofleriaceae bacterium]
MQGEDPARIRATIARAALFAQLPINAIEDLTGRMTVRKVAVGSAVVSQDEPGDAMFLIMNGRVKVVMFGESGREVTLSLLRAGDSFGEMSLFDQ